MGTVIVREGRFFSPSDSNNSLRVTVLGHSITRALFPVEDPLGRQIRINGIPFTVVGTFRGPYFIATVKNPDPDLPLVGAVPPPTSWLSGPSGTSPEKPGSPPAHPNTSPDGGPWSRSNTPANSTAHRQWWHDYWSRSFVAEKFRSVAVSLSQASAASKRRRWPLLWSHGMTAARASVRCLLRAGARDGMLNPSR